MPRIERFFAGQQVTDWTGGALGGGGAEAFSASGGSTGTYPSGSSPTGTFKYHKFTSSSTFTVDSGAGTIEVFVVGGGGSGAHGSQTSAPPSMPAMGAGGGGAGGYVEKPVEVSSTGAPGANGVYTVTIGAGGGSYGTKAPGIRGTPSSFGSIEAYGGGGGGIGDYTFDGSLPAPAHPNKANYEYLNDQGAGGCGGGFGAIGAPSGRKVLGRHGGGFGQGSVGGVGYFSNSIDNQAGGGGGGQGSFHPYTDTGAHPPSAPGGYRGADGCGDGNPGRVNAFDNVSTTYGGGGGGSGKYSGGGGRVTTSGAGGGGNGLEFPNEAPPIGAPFLFAGCMTGVANTGGGGGGLAAGLGSPGFDNPAYPAGMGPNGGGSGICIVRYAV